MVHSNFPPRSVRNSLLALAILAVLFVAAGAFAQTTVGTGSIVGTVTDPTGAVVSGAKISIRNAATGQVIIVTSNASGAYNGGAIEPGTYKVQVTAKGFGGVAETLVVQVGNTATFSPKLQVGQETQVIEVQADEVQVNTEQATVQGVISASQIENLPVNGVTSSTSPSLSQAFRFRTEQTLIRPRSATPQFLSAADSDEVRVSRSTAWMFPMRRSALRRGHPRQCHSGIPTQPVQARSLQRPDLFRRGQRYHQSGTNTYHGEGFGYFRDHSAIAAALPTPFGLSAPGFQRNQYGGRLGGPVIKDKLFFLMDGERTLNNLQSPVALPDPFKPDSGFFNAPFRESELWEGGLSTTKSAKLFYRYDYFANLTDATFFASSFQVYSNKDDSGHTCWVSTSTPAVSRTASASST